MRIDKNLRLVVPIYDETPEQNLVAEVHSAPLSREQFEKNFILVSQTFSAIQVQGIGSMGGQSIAMLMLKKIADNTGLWINKDGSAGEGQMLVEEMRRLANVRVMNQGAPGWETVPLVVAKQRHVINDDDLAEVENAIAFFTVSWAMLPRHLRTEIIEKPLEMWGARISSSDTSDSSPSSKRSSETASSGEKSPASAPKKHEHATVTQEGKRSSIPV